MKEISIRAGIIYDIYMGKISNKCMNELIMFSDYKNTIDEFSKLYNIKKILDEDDESLNNPTSIEITGFKHIERYATNYLLYNAVKIDGKINNELDKIALSVNIKSLTIQNENYYYDSFDELDNVDNFNLEPLINFDCRLCDFDKYHNIRIKKLEKINNAIKLYNLGIKMEEELKINFPKYNYNTKGHKKERYIISFLKNLGFEINSKCSANIKIYKGIKLNGKPDGIILKSPLSIYNNMCLEIKNKKYEKLSQREIMQLYSYYKLFKKPILLINIDKKEVEFRIYNIEELKLGWKSIKKQLIENTNRLKRLLFVNNMDKYLRLKKLLNNKFIKF